jgi:hypothetical protein
MNSGLILSSVCHPCELLPISIKIQSGIELADDLLVLIILKTHHLRHLQLITCSLDLVEDGMPPTSHPIPIHPFCLYHRFLLVEVDGVVPIVVKKRPKKAIHGLLVPSIYRSFVVCIDCALLGLLGIFDGQVVGALNGCMPLEELTVILLLVIGVRGVVMRRRRMTGHNCLARATPLGGPDNILPLLGPLLTTRVHP